MSKRRWFAWWGAWYAVIFVLLNSNSRYPDAAELGQWLLTGRWTPSWSLAVRCIRAAWVNGGDINRYFAYANATLGRPYQGFFIQPLERWRLDEAMLKGDKDPEIPGDIPLVTPSRPLLPWRDFSSEHLPVLFALAIPPAIATADPERYRLLFSLMMGALLTWALLVVVRIGTHVDPAHAAAIVPWAAMLAVAAGTIIVRRYDAAASLGLCLFVWGCAGRRPVVAGLGIGLAAATKGIPIVAAPLAAAYWMANRRYREAAIATISAGLFGLAVGAFPVLVAGSRVLGLVRYHAERPLEIESTWGAALVISRFFGLGTITVVNTYGSKNILANWDSVLLGAAVMVPLAWLAIVCWWLWTALGRTSDVRSRDRALIVAVCAAFAGWMVFGKVFSPQYLTWLMPLAVVGALAAGTAPCWHLLLVLALTQVISPFLFAAGIAREAPLWFGLIVLGRNLLLLAWAISLMRRWTSRVNVDGIDQVHVRNLDALLPDPI